MRSFIHQTYASRVVFGEGSVHTAASEVLGLGARRVMVIATPRLADLVQELCDKLGETAVVTWDEVATHVPEPLAARAIAAAEAGDVDTVVTIGGGSATGLGKV